MGRKKKNKVPGFFSWKPDLSEGAHHEIAAVLLVAFSVLLLLAAAGIGGYLPEALLHGLRLGFGFAAYLLPIILSLIAWMLFQPDKYEVKANNYLGFTAFLLAITGLLHIGLDSVQAMSLAAEGLGGGYIGLGISSAMHAVLSTVTASIVLVAILFIGLITAANARITEIIKNLFAKLKRGPKEQLQINEPSGVALPSNKLQHRGYLNVGSKPPKEIPEALTVTNDADWKFPGMELLAESGSKPDAGNIKQNAATIQQTLASFGIDAAMGEVNVGPTVAQYTLKPSSGVKLNKITTLDRNLELSLAAHPIRIEAPIPGKSAVGIEIPNKTIATVRLKELITSPEIVEQKPPLLFMLGRDVSGAAAAADLAKMPHMLVAGATGSGKSVMINGLLVSLLYRNSPSDLKLILVDPKRVELSLYNDIPHLLTPVIVEPEKCISALKWAVAEMDRRYKLCAEVGKRNIVDYNLAQAAKKSSAQPGEDGVDKEGNMPYIVIVIDELADLMAVAAQDVEGLVVRLAQMARAIGIHLVLATQRPSVDVITGLIKANIPARIALSVASQFDSRTILDQAGAEKLVGKGDMLFSSPEFSKPKRIQGAWVDEKEIKGVTDYLRNARPPAYNEEITAQPVKLGRGGGGEDYGEPDDALFNEAADTVIRSGKASASLLQRRLRVGYARAARLLDLLEERGVVGPADGARPRDVMVSSLAEVGGGDMSEEGFGE